MCERELETEHNCNILTPTLMAIGVSFPFSWASQSGAWGPAFLGVGFLYHIWSPTDWISCALTYIIVQRPPSCGRHNFALIQPVLGQGYNILIFLDRMHLLLTQVHFLFWQRGRVVGQYTMYILSKSGAMIADWKSEVPHTCMSENHRTSPNWTRLALLRHYWWWDMDFWAQPGN